MDTLVRFFLLNHFHLLAPPINGRLQVIKLMFNEKHPLTDFDGQLSSFHSQFPHILAIDDCHLHWIDIPALLYLHDRLVDLPNREMMIVNQPSSSLLNYFDDGIKTPISVIQSHDCQAINSSFFVDFYQLIHQLNLQLASTSLAQLSARATTEKLPFYQCCDIQLHQRKIIEGLKSQSLPVSPASIHRLVEKGRLSPLIIECLEKKTHFIPIIHLSTDVNLGDCLYLDGCHKKDSCRYVHYLTIDPTNPIAENGETIPIPDYDNHHQLFRRNKCELLPPQWVTCDIRHIPLAMFGKFGAIIADPAWNIHMNLTQNAALDGEIASLDIPSIQDEGVMMIWATARTLLKARQALLNWGYQVNDEVLWIKLNQLKRTIVTGRTGHWLNHSKEHLVIGVKGNPRWLNHQIDVDYIVSASRETSQKPDEVYDFIHRLVGDNCRKLELYGREHNIRPGWLTLGGQLKGHNLVEPIIAEKFKHYAKAKPPGLKVDEFIDKHKPLRKKTG